MACPVAFYGGCLALMVAVLAAPGMARAQDSGRPPLPRRFRLALGLTTPTTTQSRSDFGGILAGGGGDATAPWVQLGVSYDILGAGRGMPEGTVGSLYYDTATKSDIFSNSWPGYSGVGFAIRTSATGAYGGAGLGYYHTGGGEQSSRSGLGGRLFAGYQAPGSLFFEAGQTFLPQGAFQPGFAFLVGLRF